MSTVKKASEILETLQSSSYGGISFSHSQGTQNDIKLITLDFYQLILISQSNGLVTLKKKTLENKTQNNKLNPHISYKLVG